MLNIFLFNIITAFIVYNILYMRFGTQYSVVPMVFMLILMIIEWKAGLLKRVMPEPTKELTGKERMDMQVNTAYEERREERRKEKEREC